jgi:hypothetical protein
MDQTTRNSLVISFDRAVRYQVLMLRQDHLGDFRDAALLASTLGHDTTEYTRLLDATNVILGRLRSATLELQRRVHGDNKENVRPFNRTANDISH